MPFINVPQSAYYYSFSLCHDNLHLSHLVSRGLVIGYYWKIFTDGSDGVIMHDSPWYLPSVSGLFMSHEFAQLTYFYACGSDNSSKDESSCVSDSEGTHLV